MNKADQLLLSIGALLAAERERRGIPLEKAAKETRMRIQRIRDMENDDLSHFTNPSYARMFIIAYAKYLGIPQQRVQELLPDRGETNSEGYQYINNATSDYPSLRPDIGSRPLQRPGLLTFLIGLALVVLVVGGGFLGYYLYINVERIINANAEPVIVIEEVATGLPTPAPQTIVLEEEIALAPPALPAPTPSDVDLFEPVQLPNSDPDTFEPVELAPPLVTPDDAAADRSLLDTLQPTPSPEP